MLPFATRWPVLSNSVKATSQAVVSVSNRVIPGVILKEKEVVSPQNLPITLSSLYKGCPSQLLTAKSGIGVSSSVRWAHTDYPVPDFTEYKRKSTNRESRNTFIYLMSGASCIGGVYFAKSTVVTLVQYMGPTKATLLMGKIEVKLGDIPEGSSLTFNWRGKPVFIRHRTEGEIERELSVDVASLRDPQHDSDRTKDPKWLVVIGVCTHLGCVPIAGAGDFGGYFCPCHGSHYDGSGRIRKGPAPFNLEIPEYEFTDNGTVIVG